ARVIADDQLSVVDSNADVLEDMLDCHSSTDRNGLVFGLLVGLRHKEGPLRAYLRRDLPHPLPKLLRPFVDPFLTRDVHADTSLPGNRKGVQDERLCITCSAADIIPLTES